ncbi:MAG: hypothetical protein U5K37_04235 [Natrialbaceae archaeon]|nr:hypothetical protein [Natrialbaceae archaeon]
MEPSRIENLYLGDGSAKVGSFAHGPGAIFMGPEHTGHVAFKHCNVQGFPNNGFYCSNGSGTVTFKNCFAKNNGVSNFRCSTNGDLIDGCVAYNDSTNYGWDGGYVEEHGRPLWAWSTGPITVRNSHFAEGPYPYAIVAGANNSGSRVNFESGAYSGAIRRAYGSTVSISSSVGTNPDLSMPDGCPDDPRGSRQWRGGFGKRHRAPTRHQRTSSSSTPAGPRSPPTTTSRFRRGRSRPRRQTAPRSRRNSGGSARTEPEQPVASAMAATPGRSTHCSST